MFRTIVAGTDAGAKGRNAVVLAHELAWATGARLVLVAVHPHGPTHPIDLVRRLRALRNERAPGALAMTVAGASPANALQRVAEQQSADLIVVGAHKRSRLRRVIESQPGMQVLRDAPYAVAVVPDHGRVPRRPAHVGAVVDDTPESGAALALAGSVARYAGARVTKLAGDEATAALDLLVLGVRDVADIRRLVTDVGCPVLVTPRHAWQPSVPVAAQARAART
jgi:nucleotide-binding universal stress UspA family protein